MERQIKFCNTPDGARLAYTIFGKGPPLIFLIGYPSHLGIENEPHLLTFGERFACDYTVVTFDMRGSGLSDRNKSDFSVDSEVKDLEVIIDHLKLGHVVLFGFFRGGLTSIAYAVKHPRRVSHLVLYASFARGGELAKRGISSPRMTVEDRAKTIPLARDWLSLLAKEWVEVAVPGADHTTIEYYAKMLQESGTGDVYANLLKATYEMDITGLLSKVKAPSLVLHRRGDKVCPFEMGRELASLIPNARFVPLEGNIHYPWLGDTEAIYHATSEFLGLGSSTAQSKPPQEKPVSQTRESPATDEARSLIAGLEHIALSHYCVVGSFSRYDEEARHRLKDVRQKIADGLNLPTRKRENYLVWASPGSGKTYLVQQIATSLKNNTCYHELNLAASGESEFLSSLNQLEKEGKPCLCLVDEVDARPHEVWPYAALLPYLDASVIRGAPFVFVMAGSSGISVTEMKERIAQRPKGADLLSRIPTGNEYEIPPLTLGDKTLVVLNQFRQAGKEIGRDIRSVEKLGLYYIVLNSRLASARQLREIAIRAVERVPASEDRVKYDHLFGAGDPENKEFWVKALPAAKDLANRFVMVED